METRTIENDEFETYSALRAAVQDEIEDADAFAFVALQQGEPDDPDDDDDCGVSVAAGKATDDALEEEERRHLGGHGDAALLELLADSASVEAVGADALFAGSIEGPDTDPTFQ